MTPVMAELVALVAGLFFFTWAMGYGGGDDDDDDDQG